MCNNIVALADATADGSVIFGKNSDREPNEAHDLWLIPRAKHAPGSLTQCTYISIPQVSETNQVLLAKPCWIWGAEMGANEHGLVIGNAAVFTRVAYETGPGLIGMDFLRLALERADTARTAVDVITDLLMKYGQGGNDGFAHKLFYHNSFLIADADSAWVLETAGRHWAARQIQRFFATSNSLSISNDYDLASPHLVSYAIQQGWCKDAANFSFKRCYAGPGLYMSYLYTLLSRADQRQARLMQLLQQHDGQITPALAMQILRDHGADAGTDWSPGPGLLENTVCCHHGVGPVRADQTTGAMVSRITAASQIHWVTGSSAPCTGIFKPVWLDAGLPNTGPAPTGRYNHTSLWWRHELLHRQVLLDYARRIASYADERNQLEAQFIAAALAKQDAPAAARFAFSQRCFDESDQAQIKWRRAMAAMPIQQPAPYFYRRAWQDLDKQASLVFGDAHQFTHIP